MPSAEKPMPGWLLINGKRFPIAVRTPYQERIASLLDQGPRVTIPQVEPPKTTFATRHLSSCICAECMTVGQHMNDWLKQKRLNDL